MRERGKRERRKEKEVDRCSQLRASVQGHTLRRGVHLSGSFRNTPNAKTEEGEGRGRKRVKVSTGSSEP